MTTSSAPISAADREKAATVSISPSDPRVTLAGIRQFGLAPDRSDLQDLAYAFERLNARVVELEAALAAAEVSITDRDILLGLAGKSNVEVAERLAAVEAALGDERARATALLEALTEARLQIEYLHGKFGETGSGNGVLAKINHALIQHAGTSNDRK